ncbi:hypothetical protein niasHT_025049 [Heterodera trifolii]|uniref:EF-hand domain-containing protein n=1 Tax=Heterodera trifolii TaxID=157864 RepID=A0ABD2KKR3_9BILA
MTFCLSLFFLSAFFGASFVDEAFACAAVTIGNGCCDSESMPMHEWNITVCPGHLVPKCNIFGHNCVACRYDYSPPSCNVSVACSCYYCCDPQYASTCPDGCKNCVKDGEGGCPQNSAAHFKQINDNSSLSHLESAAKKRGEFGKIDVDKSGGISSKEAIAHLVKTKNGTSADDLAKNMAWFSQMDSNGNNRIEPGEFDRSLTE